MKIKMHIKEPRENLNFAKREWKYADIEHFGHKIKWVNKKLYFEARDNNKLVGELEVSILGTVMHIEDLVVHHLRKRQGIGKRLMEAAEVYAKKKKLHKIFLETGRNWDACEFYESLGYIKTGVLPNHLEHQEFTQLSKFI